MNSAHRHCTICNQMARMNTHELDTRMNFMIYGTRLLYGWCHLGGMDQSRLFVDIAVLSGEPHNAVDSPSNYLLGDVFPLATSAT